MNLYKALRIFLCVPAETFPEGRIRIHLRKPGRGDFRHLINTSFTEFTVSYSFFSLKGPGENEVLVSGHLYSGR